MSLFTERARTSLTLAQRQASDTKVGDAFYESLDGLLQDVRMVTMVRKQYNRFATRA